MMSSRDAGGGPTARRHTHRSSQNMATGNPREDESVRVTTGTWFGPAFLLHASVAATRGVAAVAQVVAEQMAEAWKRAFTRHDTRAVPTGFEPVSPP
jgi:hypothetical protein